MQNDQEENAVTYLWKDVVPAYPQIQFSRGGVRDHIWWIEREGVVDNGSGLVHHRNSAQSLLAQPVTVWKLDALAVESDSLSWLNKVEARGKLARAAGVLTGLISATLLVSATLAVSVGVGVGDAVELVVGDGPDSHGS